jgi:hypothetical protein
MSEFRLSTLWLLQSPIDAVWEAVYRSEDWPRWWPYVAAVHELEPGDANGTNSVRRYSWKTRLPYTLSFEAKTTRVERPFALEGQVSGELAGVGRWRLLSRDGVTAVRYDWEVGLNRPGLVWLSNVARPLIAWNHRSVMLAGGRGLARHLHVPFLGMTA